MKHAFFIILFYSSALFPAAQKTVVGNVSLFNSKYNTGKQVFISDAAINGECCTTQSYSDANGYYQLVFRNLNGEAKIIVNKKGMRVINGPDLQFLPQEGRENRLNIYVFDNDEWNMIVKKIRTDLKRGIDKKYDSLLAGLKTENQQLKTALKEISLEFNKPGLSVQQARNLLDAKRLEDLYYANKQSEDAARVDLDNASESTLNAFKAFVRGDSRQVLALTDNLDPEKDAEDVARYREMKTIPYVLRARAAVMELQFDIADTAYRRALFIDSLNPDVLTEYAALLQIREENADPIFRGYDNSLPLYEKAIPLFEKLIQKYPVTYAPNYARALHNAAIIYDQVYPASMERHFQARNYLERSLVIIQGLANDEPDIYDWKLARTWASMGRFYKIAAANSGADEDMQRSDTAFFNEVTIYRKLAKNDPVNYLPELAAAIEDRAYLYKDVIGDRRKADALFKESLQVRELAAGKAQASQQTAYLYGLSNLAENYKEDKKFKEAFQLSMQQLPAASKRLSASTHKPEKDSLLEVVSSFQQNIIESGLYIGQYKEVETLARKINVTNAAWSQPYLATSLLLQGKYTDAETVFKKIKTGNGTTSQALELLDNLKSEKAIPGKRLDDVERIMLLLQE